jgi:hypothetical protein
VYSPTRIVTVLAEEFSTPSLFNIRLHNKLHANKKLAVSAAVTLSERTDLL